MNRKTHIYLRVYLRVTFLLCGLIVVLSSCRFGRRPEPTPLPITLPTRFSGTPTQSVATYIVERGTVIKEESYTGRVVLARQEDLYFRRSGRISAVYVQDGDTVEAGDIIAELDSELLQLDLEAAQLGVDIANEDLAQAEEALATRRLQAQLNLEIAQLQFQRQMLGSQAESTDSIDAANPESSLNNQSTIVPFLGAAPVTTTQSLAVDSTAIDLSIRKNQVALAQLALDTIDQEINPVLRLNLRRSEIAVERAKQAILDGQISAPFAGQVRFINLAEEEEQKAVSAYAAVARLVDDTQFQIELNLPRAQMEQLYEGLTVEIASAAFPGETVPGVIKSLPRPFGTSAGSLVEVALVNSTDTVKFAEGLTVAVNATLQSKENTVVVPRQALREKEQLFYVLLKQGESQREINVAVGILGEEMVEILAGLEPGDEVLLSQ